MFKIARMRTRTIQPAVLHSLTISPAVVLLGPRQVGKTTLARSVAQKFPGAVWLDLERPQDMAKLSDPELFLAAQQDHLVVLDEVQRMPELFPVLRYLIDQHRHSGRFLMLGSASGTLLRQSSESLAGRVHYHELQPFSWAERGGTFTTLSNFWWRGGFPLSALAQTDRDSFLWRENFTREFLERDIPNFGIRVPATTLRRFWQMLAHVHGQLWNASQLASAFGVSVPTVGHYLDILEATFMVRRLLPLEVNLKKRLVKSPKIYLRDSGVLHSLLGVASEIELQGHPQLGASWEGWVIEQIAAALPLGWQMSFYRSAAGAEIDVVLNKGQQRVAIEIKFSSAPKPTRGFWQALEDLQPEQTVVIAPVQEAFPLSNKVNVLPIQNLAGWVAAL